ncbi:MAG: uracil permease, partial [Thermotogae bacterium]
MVDEQISLVTQQRMTNWQQVLLSIQHFVAMFGATVLVPLLTGL